MIRSPFERRPKVVCIENCITNVLEERTVKLVGAVLSEHVDNAARKTSVLRIVGICLDFKFLDGIGVGKYVARISKVGHVDTAVQVVVHGTRTAIGTAVDQCS